MNFLDFMCWDAKQKLVYIKIPEECCGIKSKLSYAFSKNNVSSMDTNCRIHMALYSTILLNYNKIWKVQYELSMQLASGQPIDNITNKTGCVCKLCNSLNEYAQPNQDNNTYICFNCRC